MPDTIRTYDLQLRKLTLYPTELRAHMWIVLTIASTCPPSKIKRSSRIDCFQRDVPYYSTFSQEMVYYFHHGKEREEIRH